MCCWLILIVRVCAVSCDSAPGPALTSPVVVLGELQLQRPAPALDSDPLPPGTAVQLYQKYKYNQKTSKFMAK